MVNLALHLREHLAIGTSLATLAPACGRLSKFAPNCRSAFTFIAAVILSSA
ncbi:MAG TPA: hypothetical protein VF065_01855 [Ilumatobacter sp.]